MQPPLTDARKNNVANSNKRRYLRKNIVNRKMIRSNIYHKTRQSPHKEHTRSTTSLYTVFQKKTSTHIIGYKLRNSCPILIIFDIKIPHII